MRAGQGLASDHGQECRGDDVADTGQAVSQREKAHLAGGSGRAQRNLAGGSGSRCRRSEPASGIEGVPHGGCQQRSQHAKGQPARRCRPLQLHQHGGCQTARNDAQAWPDVDQRPHGGYPSPCQLLQAKARGVQEDHGARHAGGKPQERPSRRLVHCHAQRQKRRDDQPAAHELGSVDRARPPQAPPDPGLEGACHGADEVSQVIGARQQACASEIHRMLRQHQGQKRREREAADAHCHSECNEAPYGDGERREGAWGRHAVDEFLTRPDRLSSRRHGSREQWRPRTFFHERCGGAAPCPVPPCWPMGMSTAAEQSARFIHGRSPRTSQRGSLSAGRLGVALLTSGLQPTAKRGTGRRIHKAILFRGLTCF